MGNAGRVLSTNLQLEKDAWRQRALAAEAKLKRRDKEGADLLERLDTVRTERGALQKALRARAQERDAAAKKATAWRESYDEAVGAARGYQLQANQLESVHAAAISKTVTLAAEVEALQMAILEKDKRISELEAREVNLPSGASVVFQPRSSEIDKLNEIIRQTEADLKQAEAEAGWARGDLAKKAQESEIRLDKIGALEAKVEDLMLQCKDWRKRRDRVMAQRDGQTRTLARERRMHDINKKELESVKKMWAQTMDSRATLWHAIELALLHKKKKDIKAILEAALEDAYIEKWKGDSTVVVLSDVVEDMYKALCPRCKKGKDLKKKGQTRGHVEQNLFGGESFVMCGAHDLRVFVEKRYDKK